MLRIKKRSFSSHPDFQPQTKASAESLNYEQVKPIFESEIETNPVMVYMKGVPEAPQCGFSKQICILLHKTGYPFAYRNVLAQPEFRDGIKKFSDWPTIPQVYINKEFVGGLDVVKSLYVEDELHEMVAEAWKGKDWPGKPADIP